MDYGTSEDFDVVHMLTIFQMGVYCHLIDSLVGGAANSNLDGRADILRVNPTDNSAEASLYHLASWLRSSTF